MTNKLSNIFNSGLRRLRAVNSNNRIVHTSPALRSLGLVDDSRLASVTNPFLYTEFDVVYHNQALGYKAQPVLGTNIFSLPSPNPLFSLIPAEYSATIHLKKFTEDLGIELSSVRLREHFVKFNNVLPGSGTLICRTSLREMADSYQYIDKDKAILVIEVELWSTEADLSAMDFLMMNQFCFSCSRGRNISRNHKRDFPSSLKKLQWPLLDSVSTSNCFVKAEPKKLNLLSKIGRENKCPNDANIFNLLSWRQEHLEGIGLITFVTNKICEEMDIDVRKIAAIKSGLRQGVAEGSLVVTNMWTEDFTEDQFKVYFDSADFNSGRPLIQGAYILVQK